MPSGDVWAFALSLWQLNRIGASLLELRHNFYSSLLISFTQLDRISHQAWHFAHKTRLTYQIPCSAQMSLLFNMCLLPVFCLNPFVFWCAFFNFSIFTWYPNLLEQKNETEVKCRSTKINSKKSSDLQVRCENRTNLLGISGRSIRVKSAVSKEIKAQATHVQGLPLFVQLYATLCSRFYVCVLV